MKRILFLLSFVTISLFSSAQKYQDALLYGENKNRLDVFYLLGIPNDTFAIPSFPQDKRRKPHLAAKGNTMYLWDTIAYKWNQIVTGGSGSGIAQLGNSGNIWLVRLNDSTYAVDTSAANSFYRSLFVQTAGAYADPAWITSLSWSKITGKPTTLAGYGITNGVDSLRRVGLNWQMQRNGTWISVGTDSLGSSGSADGKVDSVRFNSTTNTLTVYQDIAADQSVRIPPSYLNFDSSYTPLGGMRNDSTGIIKSVRIRRNNVTVTPTQIGDSAMYWNIDVPIPDSLKQEGDSLKLYFTGANDLSVYNPAGAGNDSAYVNAYLTADSTALIMVRDNNGRDTFHFRVDTTGWATTNIYNSDGYVTGDRNIDGGGFDINFHTFKKYSIAADSINLFPGKGNLRIDSLNSGSSTDSVLVWDASTGLVKKINASSLSGGGGGGSPAGNFGNVQINRNGAFATPGSDSLNFSAGLAIKGALSATALATGGANADSVVMVTSAGEFKKRNISAFARMNTTSAANQFALFNGNGTLYSSSKFVFSDATYPSMSIVGSDPLMYFGGTGAAYPSIGKSGNSIAIYGPSTGKSIGFYDQLVGGKQMLRLYTTSGSVATFSKTAITLDTAVGGPSIGSVHVEYNAGDSTSAGTDVGRHMFRGIGRTYANAGSFNTFYSTVEAGNTTYSQDHIISWQSDAKKTGANTLNIIYHLGILGDSIKAGTVNNRWGVYMYDAKVTAGATLAHQSALRVPKLASGVRNYDMFSDSAQTVKMDGNLLIGDSSLATGARKTIHLFNGTAPSSNISGAILYSESGEFKIRNSSGAINSLSGNAVFSGTITTADPGAGAGAWKFGQFHSASGLILDSAGYIEVNIGGTVYWLALAATPFPKPNPKP